MNESPEADVQSILTAYLTENHLAKTACVTTCHPAGGERGSLAGNFNYICFCAPSSFHRIEFLFLAYVHGYRRVDYDVLLAPIEDCLTRRQFGFVWLTFSSHSDAHETIGYVVANKERINRRYPILLRIECRDLKMPELPKNTEILLTRDGSEAILKVM